MNNIISIVADFSNDKCYPTAYIVKGDTGDVFNISIHKDGANADLSDITLALITFRQGEFSASQEGTIKGSTVSFTLNPACVRIGANLGEVALYHNDTLVTTALFCVTVRSSLQDEGTTIPEDESPTLIEFIEKYSGGSGSSKQDDWNQNDTMAADYIKNRPGAYMGDETIYDGTPITALTGGSNYGKLSPAFTLTAGNAYRVTFNGTAYVLTAQDKTAEVNAIILGELTSDNKPDFTNYPFCVGTDLKEQLTALFTETAGKYKLKVESLGTVVVPLDSKFMPLGYATEAFVTNAIAGYATEEFVTNAINAALYVDSETEVG